MYLPFIHKWTQASLSAPLKLQNDALTETHTMSHSGFWNSLRWMVHGSRDFYTLFPKQWTMLNICPVWVFSWKFKKDRPILQMQCPILVFETVLWVLVAAELFSHSFRNIEVEACYLKIWPAWVPNGVKFQNDRPTTQMQMLHSGFSKQFFDCWWLQSFFHTHSKTVRLSYVKDMTSLSTFMKVSTR